MRTRLQPEPGSRGLEEVGRRFQQWRSSCRGQGRIPKALWELAAEAAAVHGLERTAARLQLRVGRLKHWMEQFGYAADGGSQAQFVELQPLLTGSTPECTLELEEPSGRKLRISLKGQATDQALELSEMLRRDPS